jgi:hypothetical protein
MLHACQTLFKVNATEGTKKSRAAKFKNNKGQIRSREATKKTKLKKMAKSQINSMAQFYNFI